MHTAAARIAPGIVLWGPSPTTAAFHDSLAHSFRPDGASAVPGRVVHPPGWPHPASRPRSRSTPPGTRWRSIGREYFLPNIAISITQGLRDRRWRGAQRRPQDAHDPSRAAPRPRGPGRRLPASGLRVPFHRRAPHRALGRRRRDAPGEPRAAVPAPPPRGARRSRAGVPGRR
jgi:hypothetical protein